VFKAVRARENAREDTLRMLARERGGEPLNGLLSFVAGGKLVGSNGCFSHEIRLQLKLVDRSTFTISVNRYYTSGQGSALLTFERRPRKEEDL